MDRGVGRERGLRWNFKAVEGIYQQLHKAVNGQGEITNLMGLGLGRLRTNTRRRKKDQ